MHRPHYRHLTLRELLTMFTVVGFGAGALFAGAAVEAVFVAFVAIASMAVGICSLVATGRLQAVSLGYVVPASVYILLVCLSGIGGFGPNYELPSTRLLGFGFKHFHGRVPLEGSGYGYGGYGYGYGAGGDSFEEFSTDEMPDPRKDYDGFLVAGHVLICVLLGFAGAKFSGFVWEVHRVNQGRASPSPPIAAPPTAMTAARDKQRPV